VPVKEANRAVFDREADSYTDLSLMPAERRVLELLGDGLHEMSMLDLGIGTGRTGYTFAPLVQRYVGLDYSARMLERAQRRLDGESGVELVLGDACDLSGVGEGFDFVLFSFNGIDAADHEERMRILSEVRRVMKPDGRFLFSSHSLGALPLAEHKTRSPRFDGSKAYEAFARLRDVRYGRKIRAINERLDLDAARERGWVIVEGRGHNFQVDDYYIDSEHQIEQLRGVGFEVGAVFDVEGERVRLPYEGRDPWLDYLCQPV
jgi:SAM-dependent methyltransferase